MKKLKLNLRLKIFLMITVLFLSLLMVITILVSQVMIQNIRNLENVYLEEQMKLAQKALNYEIESVANIAFDWAVWDATYDYLRGTNPTYISDNFNRDTFVNLGIDKVLFLGVDGKPLYSADPDYEELFNRKDILEDVQIQSLLNVLKQRDEIQLSGFYHCEKGNMILTIHQVLKNDGTGEAVGFLVMGRWLDQSLLYDLNQKYNLNMNIFLFNEKINTGVLIVRDNEIILSGNTEDILGNQIVGIEVSADRDLYKICALTSKILLLGIIFALVLFDFLLLRFINKHLLSRVISLSGGIKKLATGDDTYFNQDDLKEDEISSLHKEIKEMYRVINEQRVYLDLKNEELSEVNSSLEIKVQQRSLEIIKTNELLRQSEENYRTIVSQFPDWIFKINMAYEFIEYEGGNTELLLSQPEEFIGKKIRDIMDTELSTLMESKVSEAILTRQMQIFNYQLDMDHQIKEYEARIIPLKNGEVYSFVRDITESQNSMREIEYLSYHDHLTGLFNRRFFVGEFIRLNTYKNMPLSIFLMDVNGLKLINDAFGHQEGDHLLCMVSDSLKKCFPDQGLVARIGGDEFAAIIPNTDEKQADILERKIKEEMKQNVINGVTISISIGHSTASDTLTDVDYHLHLADERMYATKVQESQSMRENALTGIYNTLVERSEVEKRHCEFVSEFSMLIGKQLQFGELELSNLYNAARFHDIGKLGIDKEILAKAEHLVDEEFEAIKRHSEISYQIIKSVNSLSHVANVILHHHERWDGKGYPSGLSGEDIPLLSRIICIADAFESMIHYRKYKQTKTIEEAKEELLACRGDQFDSELVDVFVEVIDRSTQNGIAEKWL